MRFAPRFCILNILPLTHEQINLVVAKRLGRQSVFFSRLLAATDIRNEQDRLYAEAFPSAQMRDRVETFAVHDLFKLPSSDVFDPKMRQRTVDGLDVHKVTCFKLSSPLPVPRPGSPVPPRVPAPPHPAPPPPATRPPE